MRPRIRRQQVEGSGEAPPTEGDWRRKHYEKLGTVTLAAVAVILVGSCEVRRLRAETEDTFDSKVRGVIEQVDIRKKSADKVVDKLGVGFEDAKEVCGPLLEFAEAFNNSGLLPKGKGETLDVQPPTSTTTTIMPQVTEQFTPPAPSQG